MKVLEKSTIFAFSSLQLIGFWVHNVRGNVAILSVNGSKMPEMANLCPEVVRIFWLVVAEHELIAFLTHFGGVVSVMPKMPKVARGHECLPREHPEFGRAVPVACEGTDIGHVRDLGIELTPALESTPRPRRGDIMHRRQEYVLLVAIKSNKLMLHKRWFSRAFEHLPISPIRILYSMHWVYISESLCIRPLSGSGPQHLPWYSWTTNFPWCTFGSDLARMVAFHAINQTF
ncbi:hypothetical protein B0H14DRAFT_2598634 [Mycena olivaceomarginata]|nr:hypothetical protein B0H14DRAFT_2598634 [Mycena olivaceomarginata]